VLLTATFGNSTGAALPLGWATATGALSAVTPREGVLVLMFGVDMINSPLQRFKLQNFCSAYFNCQR
jgi:hypothetical protein